MSGLANRNAPSSVGEAALAARFDAAALDWIVPRWPAPASVHAFCTTRNGGVSGGPRASLDLGRSWNEEPEARDAIAENRRRVLAFLPSTPVWLDQVHGPEVTVVDDAARRGDDAPWPRADGAATRLTGVVLAVRVADCLPVLFSDVAGSVIGIAHAGWRGLAAGVLENTVAAMACPPRNLLAWLGPAIGASAFEVGDDVRDAFVAADAGAAGAFAHGRDGKWLASLDALARRRLARAGVTNVSSADLCTASDPARFFSYRRDRSPGRMAAFIWRTPA